MAEPLSDRARDVLHAIIREYISTGGPVGSQQLAPHLRRSRSPRPRCATCMADLEELGYLEKPHTSAGRVPTDRGYRFYVDTLMRLRDPTPGTASSSSGASPAALPSRTCSQEASARSSTSSPGTPASWSPRARPRGFHRIEFVRLRENRVLAILVDQNGQVHNRSSRWISAVPGRAGPGVATTSRAAARGSRWRRSAGASEQELDQDQAAYNELVAKALKLGAAGHRTSAPTERVFIEGTGSFLEAPGVRGRGADAGPLPDAGGEAPG